MASQKTPDWRPKAEREGLLVEETGGELVVYNLERHRVHCLNDAAARIWKLCTGRRTVEQIVAQLEPALDPASHEVVVRDEILEFERLGLVEALDGAVLDAAPKISRRQLVRKISIGALAAGIAIPLVTSIVAPTPAEAASPCSANTGRPSGCPCSNNGNCASHTCNVDGFCT